MSAAHGDEVIADTLERLTDAIRAAKA